MNCNGDFNSQMMDLNNNYIELNNDLMDSLDNNQYSDNLITTTQINSNDNQTSIQNEFSATPFDRNVQTRDDEMIEFIVETYLFIEKSRSVLLSFCW